MVAYLLAVLLIPLEPTLTAMPRIRVVDAGLASLFRDGLMDSPTLRTLRAEIEASDVIVHIVKAPDDGRRSAGGLTFLTVSGGFRFVRIRIVDGLSARATLVLMGHELQHAREVARNRSVVDLATFEQFYWRTGFAVTSGRAHPAYDTSAAREIEQDVRIELQAAAVARRRTLTGTSVVRSR